MSGAARKKNFCKKVSSPLGTVQELLLLLVSLIFKVRLGSKAKVVWKAVHSNSVSISSYLNSIHTIYANNKNE